MEEMVFGAERKYEGNQLQKRKLKFRTKSLGGVIGSRFSNNVTEGDGI
jgi:hypothetical protein